MELVILIVPVAAFLSVTLLAIGISNLRQRGQLVTRRLERYSPQAGRGTTTPGDTGLIRDKRLSSFASLDEILRQVRLTEGMALDLARAALPLRVGEYILIRLLFAAALALVPAIAGLPFILTVVLAVVGFYLPKLHVKRCQTSRLKKLNDQLVDLTEMIASSLKAGYSFIQGLETVARELPPPISEEVSQVLREMSLGSNAEEALTNLSKRVNSYDLDLIVTAMLIHRQVGGNLSEILESISSTIRARVRMIREVSALTSEARLSAYVVGLLPFFLMGILMVVSPSYMSEFLTNPRGQMLLGAALVLEGIGFFMLQRMTAIEV